MTLKRNDGAIDSFFSLEPDEFKLLVNESKIAFKSLGKVKLSISKSEMSVDNAFNITLDNEDNTIGNILQHVLYEKHYDDDKTLTFVGFKKLHPHDTFSVLKLAFIMEVDNNYIRQLIRTALSDCMEVFDKIKKMFS